MTDQTERFKRILAFDISFIAQAVLFLRNYTRHTFEEKINKGRNSYLSEATAADDVVEVETEFA